jgi:hypothetical protein
MRLLKNRKAVFSAWSMPKGYKKDKGDRLTVEFRDTSLPGYELGSREIEMRI